MSLLTIDGSMLRKFIISGANCLNENKELVDSLNVFPVPDGDTGTNMSLTVLAAAAEVEKMNTPNIYDIAKAASSGSLRGARGNSGVILSQLFRGFAKGMKGRETANAYDVAFSFAQAMETAYKAVMKPKEGTILTVAKALSDSALEKACETDDIMELVKYISDKANEVLNQTTNMLPQLKQAGVVDAGGKGLLCIIEGGIKGIWQDDIKLENFTNEEQKVNYDIPRGIENTNIEYGYCTEFFIEAENISEDIEKSLKAYLQSVGNSIVMVSDDNFIKIHVHTNNPGKVLERALKIGSLDKIKIENMRIQHTNRISFYEGSQTNDNVKSEKKEIGFSVISSGSGFKNIFEELGVDKVIEGGQTMNPSTEDILKAIKDINSDNIVILPNNKNIILAAKQAAQLCKDKKVYVIETKSVTQGISAIVNYMPSIDIDKNIENMTNVINEVITGQITYAVRDTVIDNKEIKAGDYLCMIDNNIEFSEKDLQTGAKRLIEDMINKNQEASFISIYYGKDANLEMAEELSKFIEENYSDYEFEIKNGEQPLYYYIISLE